MPALRTSLVALALGGATVTTGLVATSATAAPVPVAAVRAAGLDPTPSSADEPADPSGGSGHPVRADIRQWWQHLTEEQRQCLEGTDLRRPLGRLDDGERTALREQVRAAADGCGVELPIPRARAVWSGLTDEQRQCVSGSDLTRPVGPLTQDERQQLREEVRAAADACGVTLPARPTVP